METAPAPAPAPRVLFDYIVRHDFRTCAACGDTLQVGHFATALAGGAHVHKACR